MSALLGPKKKYLYLFQWIDSTKEIGLTVWRARFIEELPEKFLEKNTFFDDNKNEDNDFEFNQDFEIEEGTRSPGWIRYQKRIKWVKKFEF